MKILSNQLLQEKIGWKPHPKQKLILESKKKEIVLSAGRGFGKSMLCAYLVLKALLKGGHVLLIAPTYSLNDRVLEHLEKWMRIGFPSTMKGFSKRVPQSISIPLYGSKLECRSAEAPEGMLGKRFDLVIVDEAAKIPRKVWERYIYPTTQIKGGKIVYISTPMGLNWFFEEWTRTKGFQFTSRDNPYFTKKDWEDAKKVLPEIAFHQEHEAKFISDATAVFRGIDKIVYKDCLKPPFPHHKYTMGVDLGKERDFTVLSVMDRNTNHLVAWKRYKKISWNFQKKRILATAKEYNNARIIIDKKIVGEYMVEQMRDESDSFIDEFGFKGGKSTDKKELIERLAIFIEQQKIYIPPIRTIIDELRAYTFKITEAGRITYGAPQGLHDDCVISLALAVWGLTGKPKTAYESHLERMRKASKPNYKKRESYI